ncbi:Hypothetical protein A7982_08783 [Minicystis rosea]|nr:Hypothetical protein A7982_08783 [Minicystis rosea]
MRRLLFILLAFASVACGGSRRASDADWTPEPQSKDRRGRDAEGFNGQLEPLDDKRQALLGVRHDVMLSNGPHPARCNCLAVEVGNAREGGKFFWLGSAPDTGPDAMTIAIGSRGIDCPGGDPDERRRRPSISAVDVDGDDVIIEVENLPEGRPLASGAVIPKPGPKGGIYLRTHKNNGIYGKNPGSARCRVR